MRCLMLGDIASDENVMMPDRESRHAGARGD